MAAGKPIVSTSITDVSVPYGRIVPIEDEPQRFAAACQEAIVESTTHRVQRIAKMNAVLASASMEKILIQSEQFSFNGHCRKGA